MVSNYEENSVVVDPQCKEDLLIQPPPSTLDDTQFNAAKPGESKRIENDANEVDNPPISDEPPTEGGVASNAPK